MTKASGAADFSVAQDGSLVYVRAGTGVSRGVSLVWVDRQGREEPLPVALANYRWPRVSPDGTQITFASPRDGALIEVYVMNADGTNQTRITFNPTANDDQPDYSPDGTKIVFGINRDGNAEIYVMQADGSEQKRLTSSPGLDRAPAWSPDGSRIAFESDRLTDLDIFVMNADGTDPRPAIARPAYDQQPT